MTNPTQPIAMIGIGCRFPGADSPAAYWDLLSSGRSAIGIAPAGRLDLHDRVFGPQPSGQPDWRGGFLDDVFAFDCDYFSITPREARAMDPQQRLVLQTAAMAIEDACLSKQELATAITGVFTGVSSHDYSILSWASGAADLYSTVGTASGLTANRVSHWLNATGPSIALDTACSSALVALHCARQSLVFSECDFALCAASAVMLLPEVSSALQAAGMVSTGDVSRPFDAGADGYLRGEGAGAVLLCRLEDALEQGYRIYAVLWGSVINHNGLSNGLTAPNPKLQAEVIRRAYANAGLAPNSSTYIESMAAAQVLADTLELKALQNAVGNHREAENPCLIGSVKGNLGHLEAASGMAGLIKVALALKHAQIPATVGVRQPNPFFARDGVKLELVQQLTDWPASNERIAGVSAFGFGGANAHVVLSEAPDVSMMTSKSVDHAEHVLTLSAWSSDSLDKLIHIYRDFLLSTSEDVGDICYSTNLSRTDGPLRVAVAGKSRVELAQALEKLIEAENMQLESMQRLESLDAKTDTVVGAWLKDGAGFDWKVIHPKAVYHRIGLPGYPFAAGVTAEDSLSTVNSDADQSTTELAERLDGLLNELGY